jgi:uncharacterized protein (TIGR02646 family)
MIRYVKGVEPPRRLDEQRATPGADFEALGADEKQALRDALVRDQGALCAYCQRRISAGFDAMGRPCMTVEHWAAQASRPDLALTWTNLLGVCRGSAPVPPDLRGASLKPHCDVSRANKPLFLHPVEGQGPDPRQHLRYTTDGHVEQARPLPPDRNDIETLRLNDARLTRAREEIYTREIVERLRGQPESAIVGLLRRIARANRIIAGSRAPQHAEFVRYHVLRKLRQRGESE